MSHRTPRIPDISVRDAAHACHQQMKEANSSPAAFGAFYRSLLWQKLWPSQAALADDLGVSRSTVARAVAITRFPQAITEAFGGADRISFRTASAIATVIRSYSVESVVKNAQRLAGEASLSTEEILTAIATGRDPVREGPVVTLTLDRRARSQRLESPHIDKLVSKLPEVEALLQVIIKAALVL